MKVPKFDIKSKPTDSRMFLMAAKVFNYYWDFMIYIKRFYDIDQTISWIDQFSFEVNK